MLADDLDLARGGQQARSDPVEDGHRARAPHADRLELRDVLLHRRHVATGPAGDDELRDLDATRGAADPKFHGRYLNSDLRVGRVPRQFFCIPFSYGVDFHDTESAEESSMSKFVISPHFRLQEWVAEEKGHFKAEGLDYEFRDNYGPG